MRVVHWVPDLSLGVNLEKLAFSSDGLPVEHNLSLAPVYSWKLDATKYLDRRCRALTTPQCEGNLTVQLKTPNNATEMLLSATYHRPVTPFPVLP